MEKESLNRIIMIGISIAIFSVLSILAFLTFTGKIKYFLTALDWFILAMIFGIAPYSFYEHYILRRVDLIEERLSDFLRDLAESKIVRWS